jgi:hypothetical protein
VDRVVEAILDLLGERGSTDSGTLFTLLTARDHPVTPTRFTALLTRLKAEGRIAVSPRGMCRIPGHVSPLPPPLREVASSELDGLHPGGSGRPGCWMLVTNSNHLVTCHDRGLWGDIAHDRIARLEPGDYVALYVRAAREAWEGPLPVDSGSGWTDSVGRLIGGAARVTSTCRATSERIWRERLYPYTVDIEWVTPFPPGRYINLRSDPSEISASQGEFMRSLHPSVFRSWLDKLLTPGPQRP